jgi:hypothetical protein
MKKDKEEPKESRMSHPRRDLPFTCSRRNFFGALLQELFVISGSLKGKQPYQLSELGSLPDDELAQVKPIVNPDYKIFADQGHIWGQGKKTEVTLKLFPMAKENLAVFNLFDGQHNLGQISEHLSQEMDWDEARGFGHARNLFLSLVSRLVCVPKDPLEPNGL